MADEPKTPPPSAEAPLPAGATPVTPDTIADLLDNSADFSDLTGAQRTMIRRLFKAEKPSGDANAWLAGVRQVVGAGAKASAPTVPSPAAYFGGKSDGGAPGSTGTLALPDNIALADANVLRAMKPADRKAWAERTLGIGLGAHPAHRRR